MKFKIKIFFLFILSLKVFAVDLESRKLNMESMISEQLSNQLNQVLPEDTFSIMTDVDIFMDNVKIIYNPYIHNVSPIINPTN